jgi:hypothetical protein
MRCLLFLIGSVSFAGNIAVTVLGTTQTQILVSYEATATGACTLTATDNNNGPPVADLDAAKFIGADQDLSRTVANGFLWPTLITGLQRTVVIGTHDQVKKGADGKSYSTALQVNSDYLLTVSCNGGADTGATHAQTQNLPYASYYPELPIPDPTQITFGTSPTINWLDRSVKYIDPITGVLIQRMTGPEDSFDATSYKMIFASPVIDVNGSAWSNPANFATNQAKNSLASTSTPNAPIFAPFDPTFLPYCCGVSFTDFQVTPYGSASSGSVSGAICPSLDSGQSCASAGPVSVSFATSVQAYTAIPSGYPSGYFSAWGGMNTWFGSEDLSNRTFAGVNCSGTPTVCTIPVPASIVGFNLTRTAGTSFYISGCSTGTPARFTIATVDNWAQITTQQNAGGVWTGCTYRDLGAGIRAVLAGSGTLNLSITGAGAASVGGTSGSNGARWAGGLSPVTDIATDCSGNTRSPAISGYLVGLVGQGVYLIQSDGTTCLQSNLYNHTYNVHGQALSGVVIPFLNDRCFLLPDYQSPQHVWKACHVANNYQAITSTYPSSNTIDNFTWTDLGTIASGIGAQVTAAGGTMGTAYASGLFTLGLDTVGDNGSGSGIIQYRLGTGGNDTACGLVWADANNNLISSIALWGTYPVGWAACHFGGELAAGYSLYSAQAESSQLSPIFFSSTVVAGGPFVSRSSEGIYKNGSLVTWSMAISSCTKASPAVCTSTANNLDNITGTSATQGAWIQIAGMTGSGWSGVNGPVFAHKIDNNTFSLYSDPAGASPINSTGFGTLGGAITATMLPPLYSVQIGSVVNNGGNARMVSNLSGGYSRYFPSGTLVMQDGDPIAITQNYLNSTTQYYAKVSSAPAGDFDVYNDSALTSPASYTALSGTAGWYATLAQTCPDPATLSLPGPQYMDTGIGTTGAGHQKVRCVKIRLHDEGCSDFPAAGEHALYPCASDSANVNRSSLHAWNVGDAIGDVSHLGNNHEILYVLAIHRVSTNQIDVTLERSYGDDPNYGWRGYFGCLSCDYYNAQHSPGWTPWAEAPIPGGLIQAASSPGFAIPPVNGSHNDFVPGITSGNVSQVSGYLNNTPNSRIDVGISTFIGPLTGGHSSFPYWTQSNSPAALTSLAQSYPSMRMIYGQAPHLEMNSGFSWNSDWMAMNGSLGYPQNNGDGVGLNRTLTNISGSSYDPARTTSTVYLIPTMQPGAVNIKIAPVYVTNWPSGVFTDVSGPGSLVTDASLESYCVVYAAGECRPGSSVGQVFVAMRNYSDAYGQCITNNATLGYPCAFGLSPHSGWAVQVRNNPIDTHNLAARRLTLGWTLPLSHYSFSSWISTPDAKWGLFAGNPIQQHPLKGSYTGTQWFAMKLPPSPDPNSTLRATFVPMRISLTGISGDTVRIAFGYAENGNPANFYCTSRAEACYTSASATTANPFVFASETQAYTNCFASCEVTIPAIPGRILYYVVERQNGSNNTVSALGVVTVREVTR